MTDAPDPLRAKVSLLQQADEASRELTMRYKVYSMRVKAGKMSEAEKAHGISTMRAIRDTLRLFAMFEPEIRDTLKRCLERRAVEDEVAALKASDSVVGALADAFPGATVTVTASPLTTHHSPLTPALEETTP